MSLFESPDLTIVSSALRSTKLTSQEYVSSLVSLPNHYAASASAPTNSIYLFDKLNLLNVQILSGHEASITSLRTINTLAGLSRPLLASSGRDGLIKIWDERSGNVSMKSESIPRTSDSGIEIPHFF